MEELHLYGPIGNVSDSEGITAESFSQTLSEIDPEEPLDLFISSPGGVVRDGLTMYSELVRRPGPVNVHVQGVVGSIASVIAMAGDTITIAESARYMIHNPMGPSAIAFGEADTLRQAAEETLKVADVLDGMRDATADVYAARTGTDREQILEWMAAETWFNSEESMRHGFADKIASNKRMVALAGSDEIVQEVDLSVSAGMITAAEQALQWREEYNRGGTQVGARRARQIINDQELSADTWRRVKAYFARHEVDKQAEGWNQGEDGFPSAGRIAWGLWGGDAGQKRANKIVDQLDREAEAENAAPFAEAISNAAELEAVQQLLQTLPPPRSVAASKDLFRLAERKLRLTAD